MGHRPTGPAALIWAKQRDIGSETDPGQGPPPIESLDRGPPPPARVARGERLGADLVQVIAAWLAVADGSFDRLDGIDVGDRLPTRSLRQTAYPPAGEPGRLGQGD